MADAAAENLESRLKREEEDKCMLQQQLDHLNKVSKDVRV